MDLFSQNGNDNTFFDTNGFNGFGLDFNNNEILNVPLSQQPTQQDNLLSSAQSLDLPGSLSPLPLHNDSLNNPTFNDDNVLPFFPDTFQIDDDTNFYGSTNIAGTSQTFQFNSPFQQNPSPSIPNTTTRPPSSTHHVTSMRSQVPKHSNTCINNYSTQNPTEMQPRIVKNYIHSRSRFSCLHSVKPIDTSASTIYPSSSSTTHSSSKIIPFQKECCNNFLDLHKACKMQKKKSINDSEKKQSTYYTIFLKNQNSHCISLSLFLLAEYSPYLSTSEQVAASFGKVIDSLSSTSSLQQCLNSYSFIKPVDIQTLISHFSEYLFMLIGPSSFTILPQGELSDIRNFQSMIKWSSFSKEAVTVISQFQRGLFPKELEGLLHESIRQDPYHIHIPLVVVDFRKLDCCKKDIMIATPLFSCMELTRSTHQPKLSLEEEQALLNKVYDKNTILLGSQNAAAVEQFLQSNTNVFVDPLLYTQPSSKDTQEVQYLNFFLSILSNEKNSNNYNFLFWNQTINNNLVLYPPFDIQSHSRQNPTSFESDGLMSKRTNTPTQDEMNALNYYSQQQASLKKKWIPTIECSTQGWKENLFNIKEEEEQQGQLFIHCKASADLMKNTQEYKKMESILTLNSKECTVAPVFEEKTAFVLTEMYLSYLMNRFFSSQVLYDQALFNKEKLSIPKESTSISSLYHKSGFRKETCAIDLKPTTTISPLKLPNQEITENTSFLRVNLQLDSTSNQGKSIYSLKAYLTSRDTSSYSIHSLKNPHLHLQFSSIYEAKKIYRSIRHTLLNSYADYSSTNSSIEKELYENVFLHMGDCIYYYKDLHDPDCIVAVDVNQRGVQTKQEQFINAYTITEDMKRAQINPALIDFNLRRSSTGRRVDTRNINRRRSPENGASKKRKKKDSISSTTSTMSMDSTRTYAMPSPLQMQQNYSYPAATQQTRSSLRRMKSNQSEQGKEYESSSKMPMLSQSTPTSYAYSSRQTAYPIRKTVSQQATSHQQAIMNNMTYQQQGNMKMSQHNGYQNQARINQYQAVSQQGYSMNQQVMSNQQQMAMRRNQQNMNSPYIRSMQSPSSNQQYSRQVMNQQVLSQQQQQQQQQQAMMYSKKITSQNTLHSPYPSQQGVSSMQRMTSNQNSVYTQRSSYQQNIALPQRQASSSNLSSSSYQQPQQPQQNIALPSNFPSSPLDTSLNYIPTSTPTNEMNIALPSSSPIHTFSHSSPQPTVDTNTMVTQFSFTVDNNNNKETAFGNVRFDDQGPTFFSTTNTTTGSSSGTVYV